MAPLETSRQSMRAAIECGTLCDLNDLPQWQSALAALRP